MRSSILFLATFLVLIACEKNTTTQIYRPTCLLFDERRHLADFVIECARAANPMSDEEGEDLVKQCENTGTRIVCPEVKRCKTGYEEHPCE